MPLTQMRNYTNGEIYSLLGSILPQENRALSTYELTEENISNKLLLCSPFAQAYGQTPQATTFRGRVASEMQLTPSGPDVLTQLTTFLGCLKDRQQQGQTPSRILIPLYVEGGSYAERHWTSLVITPDPNNPNKADVVYVNSFGFKGKGYGPEEQAFIGAIQTAYPDSGTTIKATPQIFQEDSHSCGPIVVTMLSKLATAASPAQEVDGIIETYGKQPALLRQYHQDLLDNKNPNLEAMIANAPPPPAAGTAKIASAETTNQAKESTGVTFTKVASVGAGAFLIKKAVDFIWGKKVYNEQTKQFERKTNWLGILGGGALLLTTLVAGKKIVLDDKQPLDAFKEMGNWVTRAFSGNRGEGTRPITPA